MRGKGRTESEQSAAWTRRRYGCLTDGSEIDAWSLRGAGGMEMEILSYGAAICRLAVPDGESGLIDVVLGYETLDDWERKNESYFGVIAGRIAGRVPGGRLAFEGQEYQLACNDRGNHLHGADAGLDKCLWEGEPLTRKDGSVGVQMRYRSLNKEGGYPGTVEISVTFLLTSDNTFVFETEATTDQVTPISLAQHSYFNLAGAGHGSAEGHVVQIFAGQVMSTDEKMTPLGIAEAVDGTAADLRQPRLLAEVIPGLWQEHGDLYRLSGELDLKPAARVIDPSSGRSMEVSTTHDFLQFYTAAHLDGSHLGKGGRAYPKHGGLCFECQGYPDPSAGFGDILVRPGQVQRHRTIYAFSSEGTRS
jgi:aldose 1-epimerase